MSCGFIFLFPKGKQVTTECLLKHIYTQITCVMHACIHIFTHKQTMKMSTVIPPSQVLGFTEVEKIKPAEEKPTQTQSETSSLQTPMQTLMQTRMQTRTQMQTQIQQQTRLPGYLRKVVTKRITVI